MTLLFAIFLPFAGFSNIAISPFYLEFDADGRNRAGQVRFTNTTNQPRTYNISFVNFRQMSDGSYQTITEAIPGNPFADPYLEFSPRQVTLNPRESQVVRVRRRGMATAPDGEYVSHLLVQEAAPPRTERSNTDTGGISINLVALHGVSIPVIIHKGNLYANGVIQSAYVRDGYVRVTVRRSGNRSLYGTLTINDGRHEIGRIRNFRIFMTTNYRTINVPIQRQPTGRVTVTLNDNRRGNRTIATKNL